MKKLLFICITILMCSCTYKDKSIYEITYKKHSYIVFKNKGVVHNPECQYCYDKFD